ncbi:MAG: crotonyl-CoA carboxylase/reductase [Alphaproteobacteria bacterium]|nr:crotonyl-CoA carboxylase/reductase [Alphaproteobacteria bacterium]
MHATTIRRERFGEPPGSFVDEVVDVPALAPDEVLVAVMAAGLNFNAVWAGRGYPVDVIGLRQRLGEPEPFHVAGSDCAGIVWAVGAEVPRHRIGDEVVVWPGWYDSADPHVRTGGDPMRSRTLRAWGYETSWGSFAQFAKVKWTQLAPRPRGRSWAEAAVTTLCGVTAMRMLHHWHPHVVRPGDPVLIWGGAGGLGVYGIQLTRLAGGIPVAVVSDPERAKVCMALGAAGTIDRTAFDHWGPLDPAINDGAAMARWVSRARAFGQAIWDITGKGNSPAIVYEHPGEDTLPSSIYVCRPGGMVVTCAGTTGYMASLDLRFHWMMEKRFQGSHGGDLDEWARFNSLVEQGLVDPALGHVGDYDDIGALHAAMADGSAAPGKTAVLVGARGHEPLGPREITGPDLGAR